MNELVVLGLSYNGRRYHGWQSQPDGRTVQDQVQRALKAFTQQDIMVHCAGRTDAGVHACEQIIHLHAGVRRSPQAWVRALNAMLPDDIRINWSSILPQDPDPGQAFHARFSASSRSYLYVLRNAPTASAIHREQMGWDFHPLDVPAMCEAAQYLSGTHNFSSFRSSQCQAKSPVKTLHRFDISKQGNLIFFFLHANAFLHHMVRNLVGAMLYVGKGKYPPSYAQSLLEARNRCLAPPTFMPNGLYLLSIEYPKRFLLPFKQPMPASLEEAVELWRAH